MTDLWISSRGFVEDGLSQFKEGLLNVDVGLGRSLQEPDAMFTSNLS